MERADYDIIRYRNLVELGEQIITMDKVFIWLSKSHSNTGTKRTSVILSRIKQSCTSR